MKYLAVITVILSLVLATNLFASQRIALFTGNSDHKISPLSNPVNDTNNMSKNYGSRGFRVIKKLTAPQLNMDQAIQGVYQGLKFSKECLFHYAGKGSQVDGNNYLISADNATNENDISYLEMRIKHYNDFIKNIRPLGTKAKIRRVNLYFNQIRGKYDSNLNVNQDIWNTPYEFLKQGGGDCEEYAMAKYFALSELGVSADKMYLMVVHEKTRPEKEMHLVLGYYHEKRKSPYILDNLSTKVLLLDQRIYLEPKLIFNQHDAYTVDINGSRIEKINSPLTKLFYEVGIRHSKQYKKLIH